MKKNKKSKEFLEELKRVPIVTVATERCGLSRQSVYRWRIEDSGFAEEMDKALKEGEDLINDLSEAAVITLIKEHNWPALKFWLSKRSPKFKDKVEVSGELRVRKEDTPEDKASMEEAMLLSLPKSALEDNTDKHD